MGLQRVRHNLEVKQQQKGIWKGRAICITAAAAAKSLHSCPILCNPTHGNPPGSPIPGILQARTLGWVAISFSNAWKWKVKMKSLSHVRLVATAWTAVHQAPPSMGFSRQEYWSGLPLPSPSVSLNTPKYRIFSNIYFVTFRVYINWLEIFLIDKNYL